MSSVEPEAPVIKEDLVLRDACFPVPRGKSLSLVGTLSTYSRMPGREIDWDRTEGSVGKGSATTEKLLSRPRWQANEYIRVPYRSMGKLGI